MTGSIVTEQELVARARQGDHGAFEELMRQNQGRIYTLGMRLLRNKADAADMLQETFSKAFEALPAFEGKSSFSTWLYRIATNFALMKLRKEKRRNLSLEEAGDRLNTLYRRSIHDWSRDPDAHLKNQELKILLEQAIQALPVKYRTVFILHDIENLPITRIGEILSLSVPAVKSRIHRGRLMLRERLSQYFQTPGIS